MAKLIDIYDEIFPGSYFPDLLAALPQHLLSIASGKG